MSREMKHSGIAWIGEIPKSWSISKVKDAFVRKNQKAHQENPVVLSLARSGVRVRDISTNEGQVAESYYDYNPVEIDDLLINPMDLYSGANCSISKVSGVISPAYVNLRHKENICPRFYDYYFKTQYWAMAFFAHGKGISFDNRWTLGIDILLNYYIPSPSYAEQLLIADFLDKKCGEIDELVALQEKIIEELKSYKQSVITETVCKGLNPNVPMKDSGVEWIGEIPEGWNVMRLKNILSSPLQYGANESGGAYNPNLPRYVRITDILDNKLRENIDKQSLTEEQASGYILKHNDILFARSGGTVGKSFIFREEYGRCAFAGYLIRAQLKQDFIADFVFYYTQSHSYDEWKNQIFIQATIQNIGADRYSELLIPIPRVSEQQEIADYLDKKCLEIDQLITIKQQKIVELKEYKKSLIYEYTTGKKCVEA